MDEVLRIAWDDALTSDDFGHEHPLAQVRLELTMALARTLGVLDAPASRLLLCRPQSDSLLELVHATHYIHAVRNAAHSSYAERLRCGLGSDDIRCSPVYTKPRR